MKVQLFSPLPWYLRLTSPVNSFFFFFNFALPRKKKPEYSYKFHTTMPPSHPRAWYTQGRLRYTRIILCGNWVPGRPTVLFPWQLSVLWTLTSKALHCFRWPISLTHSCRRGLNRAECSWLGSHCISDLGWEQMGKEEHFMLVKSFKPVLSCELTFFFFLTVSRVHLRTSQLTWGWK